MDQMEALIPLVLNAMTLISILALVALGLAIIFGLMNVINLAHGEFVTIGAYTLALVQAIGGDYWLGLVLAAIVGGIAGFLVERLIVQHLYTRPIATILATWGLSLVLQQSLQLLFGAAPQRVYGPLPGSVDIGGIPYPAYRLLLIGFAALLFAAAFAAFRWTRFGLDLRAVIQDRNMAGALGINTQRTYALAFSAGASIAAVAGVLLAPLTVVVAQMGTNYLARSFFVVIVGGAGSLPGVLAGSCLVGGAETLLNYEIPVTVSQAVVLIIAIVIVRFRPYGLVPA
jgi:branched-chain amino acid transport system permease protein/urea transport system permease protein